MNPYYDTITGTWLQEFFHQANIIEEMLPGDVVPQKLRTKQYESTEMKMRKG